MYELVFIKFKIFALFFQKFFYYYVHGARLKGSHDSVVIKVLKPGIKDILVADLNFIYIAAYIQ